MEIENINVHQYGFGYLNSPVCEKLSARLSKIEDRTIKGMGDQELTRGLESWRHFTQRRELEMVRNIYEYSNGNVFDIGVFLVGASQKTGIVKEIEKYAITEANAINWIFASSQNP